MLLALGFPLLVVVVVRLALLATLGTNYAARCSLNKRSVWRERERVRSSAGRGLPCVGMAVALSVDDDPLCCFAIRSAASEDPDVSARIVSKVRGVGALPVISITAAAGVLARTGRLVESDRLRRRELIVKGSRSA